MFLIRSKVKELVSSVVTNDAINLSNENLSTTLTTDMNIISHYIVRSHVTRHGLANN